MSAIDNHDEMSCVRAYIAALSEELAKQKIRPRTPKVYLFDTVGLALVSKAFSISKALLILLESGFAEEAFGLSRSLVECALTLRFLTCDEAAINSRTWNYVQFEIADKQYWAHYALQLAKDEPAKQNIQDKAKQFGLVQIDPNNVRKHWSGKEGFAWKVNLDDHPLDGPTTAELSKKAEYAVHYHQTSGFVHCFAPAIENFLPLECGSFEVSESSRTWIKPDQATLFILISYLHSCVAYDLFGMNLERTQRMNDLFSETLQALLPARSMFS